MMLAAVVVVAACSDTPESHTERAGTPETRAALFDTILAQTERREAFSPLKEAAMGYEPLEEMAALRDDVVSAETEEDLYYALVRLSNARRDHHLDVTPVSGGLRIDEGPTLQAPLRILADFRELSDPSFFVSFVDEEALGQAEATGWTGATPRPAPGDLVVSVDGRSISEFVREFTPYIPYSSEHGKLWDLAAIMTRRDPVALPRWLYDRESGLELELESSSGGRYTTTLPYLDARAVSMPFADTELYPGFSTTLLLQNFEVLLPDDDRPMVLLRWLDFEEELVADVAELMTLAEERGLLDRTLVIDVTASSGGSGGAYAIQRLVSQPFRTTFGNLRISDAAIRWVDDRIARGVDENAPELYGMDLSGAWLIDWLTSDVQEAIARGDDYTGAVPFKSAHLPKDSDGILQPAPVHFRGPIVILDGPNGGSHLDQFVSMFADNGLARTIGMPTGGYSNTWEASEVLAFPSDAESAGPLVEFMWNIGHTLRPTGEILEGNPVSPQRYIPLTRDNFRTYHQTLLTEGLRLLSERPVT